MSEPCIFCKIARKEAPSSIVYEDEKAIAFLSIRPANVGHTLIAPKRHYDNIYEISEEELTHLSKIVKKVACAVKRAVNAEGIRIMQNSGEAAGQVIFHLHVHVIPMHKQHSFLHEHKIRNASALDNDARNIRRFI